MPSVLGPKSILLTNTIIGEFENSVLLQMFIDSIRRQVSWIIRAC